MFFFIDSVCTELPDRTPFSTVCLSVGLTIEIWFPSDSTMTDFFQFRVTLQLLLLYWLYCVSAYCFYVPKQWKLQVNLFYVVS